MNKITPFLWFDGNAEEAIQFYLSVFKNGKLINAQKMGDQFFSGTFELEGQRLMVLSGGPQFKFSEAISMFVSCETQAEVDHFWHALGERGTFQQCGWLKDRFGLSWQIIPTALGRLLGDPDRVKSSAVMQAMLKMTKIDIAELERAHSGR